MIKIWRISKGILLLLIFLGVLFIRLLHADTLILNTLEIDESEYITEEVFREMTEIVTHQNLLRYDTVNKGRIVESHPYIAESEIRRKFPNSLEIKLKERQEYAIIPYDGTYLIVDRELFLLRATDSYLIGEMPVLRDVKIKNAVLGERVITDNDELIRFAFEAYEALSISEIAPFILELYIIDDALVVETSEHIDVVLGMDVDIAYTVAATQNVFTDLITRNQRNISVVSKYRDYIFVENGTQMQQREDERAQETVLLEEMDEESEDGNEQSGDQ